MNRTTKVLLLVMLAFVVLVAALTIAYIAGRDGAPADQTAASSDGTTFPFAIYVAPFMTFVAIIASSQSESWPVSQAFAALRANRPDRRATQAAQYMSRRFCSSPKFAKLVALPLPSGETLRLTRDGDANRVTVRFGDGSEYIFTVIKRTKDDPKGYSGWVIDDVSGGDFDIEFDWR